MTRFIIFLYSLLPNRFCQRGFDILFRNIFIVFVAYSFAVQYFVYAYTESVAKGLRQFDGRQIVVGFTARYCFVRNSDLRTKFILRQIFSFLNAAKNKPIFCMSIDVAPYLVYFNHTLKSSKTIANKQRICK